MPLDGRAPPHRIAGSVAELFGGSVTGEPVVSDDGKTGARLERVTVDGQAYVLKYLHASEDWIMRATDDRDHRAVAVWRDGWLDSLPAGIDHAVVAAAWDERPEGRGAVLVMHDVGEHLVPEGDAELPLAQHTAFIDHMAALHATFWDRRDATTGLLPLATRLTFFGPRLAETERARGGTDPVPTRLVPDGWARLAERTPRAAEIAFALLDDPSPLVTALDQTPQTLVHGDFKAGNLGSHPDGRTILLDWAVPGIAPPCSDLAWYVCLNRARLPESKEATLGRYREALERRDVDTGPWWDEQRSLSLLGAFLQFGWEKALGDDEELAWWQDRALEGAQWLG
jgi:aminoglycoside phosphotransferase (APT) family kinase protein